MSHSSSRDPRGESSKPQLVSYVRVSTDGSYTYQCTFDCKIGCCGDERCTGIRIPIMSAGSSLPPAASLPPAHSASISSLTNNSYSPSAVAVIPPNTPAKPELEINQLLMRTSEPLDPSSPSTKKYMKGTTFIQFFILNIIYFLESEVEEFAQWHAINETQKSRGRDMVRRSTVQKYKGTFWFISLFTIFVLLAKSRCLPRDVIIFPEYDPSVDMDEKCKHMAPVNIDAVVKKVQGTDVGSAKRRRQSTPVQDQSAVLESPPSSPESPAYEVVAPTISVQPGIPLRSVGPIIRG